MKSYNVCFLDKKGNIPSIYPLLSGALLTANSFVLIIFLVLNSFTTLKQTTIFFVCKVSKNVKSKLYHIENSKTSGQTV